MSDYAELCRDHKCGTCCRCINDALSRERDDYKRAWQRDLEKGREFLADRDLARSQLETARRDIEVYEGLNKQRAEIIDQLCLVESERDKLKAQLETAVGALESAVACPSGAVWCGRPDTQEEGSTAYCSPGCRSVTRLRKALAAIQQPQGSR